MLCPGSPYPTMRVHDSPKSQRSSKSFGGYSRTSRLSSATSGGSRSATVTYKSETTTTRGIFGKKKRDAFECQFQRWVRFIEVIDHLNKEGFCS